MMLPEWGTMPTSSRKKPKIALILNKHIKHTVVIGINLYHKKGGFNNDKTRTFKKSR